MKTHSSRQFGWTWAVAVGTLMLALASSVGWTQEEPQAAQELRYAWSKYELILERNMFSRQRGQRQPERDDGPRRPAVMPNPESYFRLKGVVQEDGAFIAFVEDTQTNRVLKLRAGDAVARGTVKTLTLDTLEYQREDQVTTIQMGQDLEGGLGAVTMGELMEWSPSGSSSSTPAGASPSGTSADEPSDVLKQLLERRQKQLGQ